MKERLLALPVEMQSCGLAAAVHVRFMIMLFLPLQLIDCCDEQKS